MSDATAPRLSTLDRLLPLWILAALALGLGLGRAGPGLGAALDTVKLAGVSVPIANGTKPAATIVLMKFMAGLHC